MTDTQGYGVVFRVSNPRHRRFGRMSVHSSSFMDATGPMDIDVAKMLASWNDGRIVPYDVADRLATKHRRRREGWSRAWIKHDLPVRSRQ